MSLLEMVQNLYNLKKHFALQNSCLNLLCWVHGFVKMIWYRSNCVFMKSSMSKRAQIDKRRHILQGRLRRKISENYLFFVYLLFLKLTV